MAKIPVIVHHIGPSCVQCNQTKKVLEREGIEYTEIDLRERPDLVEKFKEMGHLSAPIVTTDTKIWSGFRLEKIKSLAQFIRSENVHDKN